MVAEVFGLEESLVLPVSTAELKQVAPRPMRGGLRTDRLRRELGMQILGTRDALLALKVSVAR